MDPTASPPADSAPGVPSPSGILSLPYDVLGEISLAYVRDNPTDEDGMNSYDWFVIAHICRKWRDAVLHTPRFWTWVILGYSAECTQMVLERAGPVLPLSIVGRAPVFEIPGDPSYWETWHKKGRDESFRLAYTQMHRMRTLDIELTKRGHLHYRRIFELLNDLAQNGTTDAPRLQELFVRNHVFHPEHTARLGSQVPLLSSAPLASLTSLKVSNAQYIWDITKSLLRPTLTFLDLPGNTLFPAHEILDILRKLPVLETLFIGSILVPNGNGDLHPHAPLPTSSTSSIVTLPHLRSLRIDDINQGRCALLFLAQLRAPKCTSVTIKPCNPLLSADFAYLAQEAARVVKTATTSEHEASNNGEKQLKISSISGGRNVNMYFHLQLPHECTATCTRTHLDHCVHSVGVHIDFPYPRHSVHPGAYVLALLSASGLPKKSVERLELSDMGLDEEAWLVVLRRVPRLRKVRLAGYYGLYPFLKAVERLVYETRAAGGARYDGRYEDGATRSVQVLPVLEHLTVEADVWCHHRCLLFPSESTPEASAPEVDAEDAEEDTSFRDASVYTPFSAYHSYEPLAEMLVRVLRERMLHNARTGVGPRGRPTRLASLTVKGPRYMEREDLDRLRNAGLVDEVKTKDVSRQWPQACRVCGNGGGES